MQSLTVLAFLLGMALADDACDYNSKAGSNKPAPCIRPTYKAETEFTFDPLLPETSKFVYAFDNVTYDDWNELTSRDKYATARAWWIEYSSIKPNNTFTRPHYTTVLTTYINGTGPTGGSNNGCENILGKTCIDKINEAIETLFTSDTGTLETISDLALAYKNKLLRDACPTDLFSEYNKIQRRDGTINQLQGSSSYLAIEYNDTDKFSTVKSGVNPSGNSSWTYYDQKIVLGSMASYINKTAVTFINRQPSKEYNKNYTKDQIQFTMLCTRISQDEIDKVTGGSSNSGGNSDNSGSNNNSNSDKGGAGSVTGVPMVATLVVSLAAFFWLGGL
ncbi:unnamed protein product [Clonostachys rhizophaga]|uniref:Uncharacterized protein n=1 Tax=Clonostachys rhizophaga TaxID=160324 RepID=A0A9N9VS15_9HYPO|nr:unnamed protein product [Clonostachys rhizophaga]